VKTLINSFPRKSVKNGILADSRNWLRCGLLIPLLMASPISHSSTIHEAAKAGNLAQIQRLTVGGADVNERAVRDETPLMVAALAGQGEIVNYLLQRGAQIDARNASGLSTLHAAAYTGHTDIVTLLVAKGANVNDASNRFGVTPLHLASEENHIGTVQVLLKRGADFRVVEINGYSAMSRAGFREHWDIVNALLANGTTCQAADTVGDWLYQECTTRANAN
jgi:ankyrin repeat protein